MVNDTISRQAALDALNGGFTVTGRENAETIMDFLNGVCKKLRDLPSAERRGRWIPITERLPEEEGQYLVCCNGRYPIEVGGFYIDEDGEGYFGCDWNDPDDIEAWMPLPEPYKGGEEE